MDQMVRNSTKILNHLSQNQQMDIMEITQALKSLQISTMKMRLSIDDYNDLYQIIESNSVP